MSILPLALLLLASDPTTLGSRVEPIATQIPAWQIAWADLHDNGFTQLIYLSRYGVMTCQQQQGGSVLWSHDLDGRAWCLTTADLDGDGRLEVLAAVGKSVVCLAADGSTRWRFDNQWPTYSIAVGRLLDAQSLHVAVGGEDERVTILNTEGKQVKVFDFPYSYRPQMRGMDGARSSVRALSAGDTTGDGLDELLVLNTYWRFALLDPRRDPQSGEDAWLWNVRDERNRWMFDARLLDLDGDGRAEAYIGGRSYVQCIGPDGQQRWRATAAIRDGEYSACRLAQVDADGDGRPELAVLAGPSVSLFAPDGTRLYHNTTLHYHFNHIADALPGRPGTVLLGSVTGADRNVYQVSFQAGQPDQLAAFDEPPGHRQQLQDNLWQIRQQVLAAPADEATPRQTYYFSVGGGGPALERIAPLAQRWRGLQDAYPYRNVVFYTFFNYRETDHPGQGIPLPRETILEIAEAVEASGQPHIFIIGHGTDPHFSLDTLAGWLQRTPHTCLGIISSELNVAAYQLPEFERHRPKFDQFVDEYLVPAIDLAAEHGKPTYLLMKQNWWSLVPAMPWMAERLFTPERRRWIIPQVEDSMTICPEVNLMGRVGLWHSGLVDRWALNIINDQLVVDKLDQPLCCDPHAALRHMVAYAALGTAHFKLKLHDLPFDSSDRFDIPHDATGGYTPFGALTYDLMIHLLGKGLLDVPTRESIAGLSPVVLRMTEPCPDYVRASAAHDVPYAIPEASAGGLLSGYEWPHLPTRPSYLPHYLLNLRRYGHGHLPETPYGLPTIVPEWFAAQQSSGKAQTFPAYFTTDGISIVDAGRTRSAAEARDDILAAYQQAAEQLPVRATNCFWSATRRGDGSLRVTLVSTDYLDPADAQVEVIAREAIAALRDVLTGQGLPFTGRQAQLTIPAGSFRIVDLRPSSP